MANEYLKRQPTSTGNRKVFTWAGWVKLNEQNVTHLFSSSPAKDNNTQWFINSAGQIFFFNREGSDATTDQVVWDPYFRDMSSWKHIIINADTTQASAADRVRCYVNGVLLGRDETQSKVDNVVNVDTLPKDQEFWRLNGSGYPHYIGASLDNSLNAPNANQFTDVFYVDGQQLGPEVFGFYKEGKGYISAGSAQATDFRSGQWSPRAPKSIKYEINRRGGFGVNGFYLPMNDSSNPGADFHCDPNSIITLKGEDLSQPRNGAPTTTDAYVSQLRSDPYAANLVLAVPGISTSTSANLISNGHFDTNTSGWTVGTADGTLVAANGELEIQRVSSNGTFCYQQITTEIGKRYTVSFETRSSTISQITKFQVGTTINGNDLLSRIDTTSTDMVHQTGSFTATGTTAYVTLGSNFTANSFWNNIVVKQEDAPRDYSADIKGSGSNKTFTLNGNAGVGYELGNYYGSAASFRGTFDHNIELGANSDFAFGTGDFTVEMWFYTNQTARQRILSSTQGGFGSTTWVLRLEPGNILTQYTANTLTGAAAAANQWHHVAVEREGTVTSMYLNGVCVGVDLTDTKNYTEAGSNNFWLSSGYTVDTATENFDGYIQDLRIYKGVAKYKGGFDVSKPYAPVGIERWRTVDDCTANNFMTMSPLSTKNSSGSGLNLSLSDGNLTTATDGTANQTARGSFSVSSGKWYFETTLPSANGTTSQASGVGVAAPHIGGVDGSSGPGYAIIYRETGGAFLGNGSSRSDPAAGTHATYVAGDIIGVALDIDNGDVEFFKNGVSAATYNFPTHAVSGTKWTIESLMRQADSVVVHNFGQNPTLCGRFTAGTNADDSGKGLFKYAPPSGFLALCVDNLPSPAVANPGDYFKTVLYTGDGNAGLNVSGVGFQPDMVWIKNRDSARSHNIYDSVRGVSKRIQPDLQNVESNIAGVSAFNSNGFSLGNDTDDANFTAGQEYVAWCWKAGGPAVTNTDGTITSQVSVNQDAGFSIVSYTGNVVDLPTGNETVGHGLNKTPAFSIIKSRDTATGNSIDDWWVYFGSDDGVRARLNLTDQAIIGDNQNAVKHAPDTSVLTLTNFYDNNVRYIVYSWAEIEGYSKFGSYIGNGSVDGSFVYCGFKPAFVMLKASTTTGNWCMIDNARNSTNPTNFFAVANAGNAGDDTGGALDFLSNGFKLRLTSSNFNGDGTTYIFAAFAESPFQTANAK